MIGQPTADPRRVVILGGGFAGVSAAQELAKRLRSEGRLVRAGRPVGEGRLIRAGRLVGRQRPGEGTDAAEVDGSVEIVLLNRDNYFVFQPLLADILSGTIETTHVVVPLRRMLRDVEVEVAIVEGIDPGRREVHARRRMGGERLTLGYDALIVALGSVTDFGSVPGMAEHALGIRTLGDAFYLRNRALDMLEEATIEPDPDRRRRLLTFVVVGGGSTGAEVAAELRDLLRVAGRTFPRLAPDEPRVVLVHRGQRVLEAFGDRLARYATRKLAQTGVELVLNRRLVRVHADRVELDDGSSIEAGTVVSTVGNAPHPVVAALPGPKDERGWIMPDATFAVPGLEQIWVLGDSASIVEPGTGRPMPATAQHAIREGPVAARNVLAVLDGRAPTPFSYRTQGMLVSLGRFKGVGEIRGVRVSGFLAWFLWRSYYLLRLPTFERRIRVAIDWTLDLILARDVVEINVRRTRTRPGEPVGEERGEFVSVGARRDAEDELVV
ncbi:MAG TPA: NAD(P)/FAD-dependent oxidoreductase [Candidatus Limnocylindrales bacterium]|nr:NAD(P)/FAD-dependent oxidoreductase [Candidatus Limnocylindrales bacterium]